jgi:hypothetical protein
MCGLFAAQKAAGSGIVRERKDEGARLAAMLEVNADAGVDREHFTFHHLEDGGYELYFAEPAFMVPSDWFYVWDRQAKTWHHLEASEFMR